MLDTLAIVKFTVTGNDVVGLPSSPEWCCCLPVNGAACYSNSIGDGPASEF